jgi:hypothetical protein
MAADPIGTADLGIMTVEAIADAVVTLDTKGVVAFWSPAAVSLWRHSITEMVGARLAPELGISAVRQSLPNPAVSGLTSG